MESSDTNQIQAQMLANRLRKNFRKLKKWSKTNEISCFRVYDRDIPEIPLCIDWYEGKLHIAEYARRKTADMCPQAHELWINELSQAAGSALGVEEASIFVKRRQRQRGARQYQRFDSRGATFHVREGGLTFEVNLSDYLDTGLFLDHRMTRDMVRGEAEGKRVLNLFGYTGAFTIYAAHGGARATTTVDLSQRYLDWTERNLKLNGLKSLDHRLIRADVLRFLWEPARKHERYDLAVVDPPTFSNSKRMRDHFDVIEHHGTILRRVLELLAPKGVIYFSNNARRFRLDEKGIGSAEIEDITQETIPADFRNQRIHRCFRIKPSRVTRRPPRRRRIAK